MRYDLMLSSFDGLFGMGEDRHVHTDPGLGLCQLCARVSACEHKTWPKEQTIAAPCPVGVGVDGGAALLPTLAPYKAALRPNPEWACDLRIV